MADYRLRWAHPWPGRMRTPARRRSTFHGDIVPPIPLDQHGLVVLLCLSSPLADRHHHCRARLFQVLRRDTQDDARHRQHLPHLTVSVPQLVGRPELLVDDETAGLVGIILDDALYLVVVITGAGKAVTDLGLDRCALLWLLDDLLQHFIQPEQR